MRAACLRFVVYLDSVVLKQGYEFVRLTSYYQQAKSIFKFINPEFANKTRILHGKIGRI
jgi:hypothetical protein